jgi:hypothetical protein
MKNINLLLNIPFAILFFNLVRNPTCYILESRQILPQEDTLPFFVDTLNNLNLFITYAVTIILARFLIGRPTIFARNLFTIIQLLILAHSFFVAYLGMVAALGSSEIVIQVSYLFLAITFINFMLTSLLIYLGYRIVRDSNLISNSVAGSLN